MMAVFGDMVALSILLPKNGQRQSIHHRSPRHAQYTYDRVNTKLVLALLVPRVHLLRDP